MKLAISNYLKFLLIFLYYNFSIKVLAVTLNILDSIYGKPLTMMNRMI